MEQSWKLREITKFRRLCDAVYTLIFQPSQMKDNHRERNTAIFGLLAQRRWSYVSLWDRLSLASDGARNLGWPSHRVIAVASFVNWPTDRNDADVGFFLCVLVCVMSIHVHHRAVIQFAFSSCNLHTASFLSCPGLLQCSSLWLLKSRSA